MAREAFEAMASASCIEFPGMEGQTSPSASVVVPVFNSSNFLDDAAGSILGQDFIDFEVVFVNDGSTDDSLAMLESFARKDPRVRVVSQFNCGAGAARNRGIDCAKGSTLLFIDPDDFYPDEKTLGKLMAAKRRTGSLMCGGSFSLVRPSGKIDDEFSFDQSFYTAYAEKDVLLENVWNDYGWIRFAYDARIFEDRSVRFPQLGWYEDPVFFVRAVKAAGGCHVIPDVVYRYRVDYKVTVWTASRVRDLLDGLSSNLEFAAENGMAELYTTLVERIDGEYCKPIVDNIDDDGVFRRLISIQSRLRADLVLPAKEAQEPLHILRPLQDLRSVEGGRDTAVVRLAHRVEESGLYSGIQRLIWRAKGME